MSQSFTLLHDEEMDARDALLLGYATGVLDEALSLLAATYAAINEAADATLRELQAVGGALFEEIALAPVSGRCLDELMARLEAEEKDCAGKPCDCSVLPAPMRDYLGMGLEELHWRNLCRGIEYVQVFTPRQTRSRAELMRMHPAIQAPIHRHANLEYTLVLDGGLLEGCGAVHQRGDLVVRPKGQAHGPASCPSHGCVALTVIEAVPMSAFFHRLFKTW